jgi:preprotein translocase subunit Sec63
MGEEDEDARRQRQADIVSFEDDEVFDPYSILGVTRETSQEEIRAAYEQVMSKYDLSLVADMGTEAQRHFKAKAEAVDRAYQMLAAVGP